MQKLHDGMGASRVFFKKKKTAGIAYLVATVNLLLFEYDPFRLHDSYHIESAHSKSRRANEVFVIRNLTQLAQVQVVHDLERPHIDSSSRDVVRHEYCVVLFQYEWRFGEPGLKTWPEID